MDPTPSPLHIKLLAEMVADLDDQRHAFGITDHTEEFQDNVAAPRGAQPSWFKPNGISDFRNPWPPKDGRERPTREGR